MISSTQNAKIKHINALQSRSKNRRDAGLFVVEGIRLVEEAVKANWPIASGIYTEEIKERGKSLVEQLLNQGIDMQVVEPHVMQAASDTKTPQGVLLVLENKTQTMPDSLDFILIPDQVRDPGNMGTLLRSAAAAGTQAVVVTPDSVDVFSPKVMRAGMGAHFHVPIISQTYEALTSLIADHKLTLFMAAANEGQLLYDASFTQPTALAVGGEAHGVSKNLLEIPHTPLSIPMPGYAESLNAGVAGSVLLFEVVRQRT